MSKRYKELIDSHPGNVNQTEWEELVDHILESKKGLVDRMAKYKNLKIIKHQLSTSNKKRRWMSPILKAQGNPH